MGTQVSLVTYAVRPEGEGRWSLCNEVVEGSLLQWICTTIESLYGKGEWVLLGETHVEVDEMGLPALKRYIEMMGKLKADVPTLNS